MAGAATAVAVQPLDVIDTKNYSDLQLARMHAELPEPSVLQGNDHIIMKVHACGWSSGCCKDQAPTQQSHSLKHKFLLRVTSA